MRDSFFSDYAGQFTEVRNDYMSYAEIPNVPYPLIFMGLVLKEQADGSLTYSSSKLYVSKVPVFSENTRLYKYPFSNVYSDQRICWGEMDERVRHSRYSGVLQAGGLLDEFISGINNDDLFNSNHSHRRDRRLFENFMDLSQNYEEYPYDTLQESLTVAELISLLKNN